jgi:hypothetical protein
MASASGPALVSGRLSTKPQVEQWLAAVCGPIIANRRVCHGAIAPTFPADAYRPLCLIACTARAVDSGEGHPLLPLLKRPLVSFAESGALLLQGGIP